MLREFNATKQIKYMSAKCDLHQTTQQRQQKMRVAIIGATGKKGN